MIFQKKDKFTIPLIHCILIDFGLTSRLIVLNGEVVTVNLIRRLKTALPWVKACNLYSLAETHDTCCSELTDDLENILVILFNTKYCDCIRQVFWFHTQSVMIAHTPSVVIPYAKCFDSIPKVL